MATLKKSNYKPSMKKDWLYVIKSLMEKWKDTDNLYYNKVVGEYSHIK